jgi:hypothetical protein
MKNKWDNENNKNWNVVPKKKRNSRNGNDLLFSLNTFWASKYEEENFEFVLLVVVLRKDWRKIYRDRVYMTLIGKWNKYNRFVLNLVHSVQFDFDFFSFIEVSLSLIFIHSFIHSFSFLTFVCERIRNASKKKGKEKNDTENSTLPHQQTYEKLNKKVKPNNNNNQPQLYQLNIFTVNTSIHFFIY